MRRQDTIFYEKIEQIFKADLSSLVMGILNVTNDSFYDGGKYIYEEQWLEHTKLMIDEGADIIDIGACSTRPNAKEISESDEVERLIPVIKSVRKMFPEILISADTFRASVAEKAVDAGANIINDISGGTMDVLMFTSIAKLQVPYILMHIQGTPQTMQKNPTYVNVVEEVFDFFDRSLKELKKIGFKKVILDPGFGFGKTVEHNYQLLKNLEKFQSFDNPVLIGISRKSMINKLLNINYKDSINGTTILNTIALEKGAKILRVHDVKEAKEAVKIIEYLKELRCTKRT
jgi:dihydropteroate synthase